MYHGCALFLFNQHYTRSHQSQPSPVVRSPCCRMSFIKNTWNLLLSYLTLVKIVSPYDHMRCRLVCWYALQIKSSMKTTCRCWMMYCRLQQKLLRVCIFIHLTVWPTTERHFSCTWLLFPAYSSSGFCLCECEPNQLKNQTMYPTHIRCPPSKWTITCEHDLRGNSNQFSLQVYLPLYRKKARGGGVEFIWEWFIIPHCRGAEEKQQRKCQSSPGYLRLCLNANQRLAEEKMEMKALRTILNRCDSSQKWI